MVTTTRIVDNCPDKGLATRNYVFVNPADPISRNQFVETGNFVFNLGTHPTVPNGSLALNGIQRKILRVSVRDSLDVSVYNPPIGLPKATLIYAEVQYAVDKIRPLELQANDVIERLIKDFKDQILTAGQQIVFEFQGSNFKFNVSSLNVDNKGESQEVPRAWLKDSSAFVFLNSTGHPIKIVGQKGLSANPIMIKSLDPSKLGIGGLDKQFEAIFRRAFASRVFPPSIVERMGINHVRGMLLYGPPGTGKTLIARQIGKMLNCKQIKVVNGPEILNKYVGESEQNIRNLFAEAEKEYEEKKEASQLHIIIFDEIDAICKSRGSVRDGSGVHDTIVNQLLTKVDGVDALNNILLIGMTNRKDMLDEALLRPGRLEVQIEISLPDKSGRHQILRIHTDQMSTNSFLARDVDLEYLADATKNFSGAELEGLVKSAASFALNRRVDLADLHKPIDEENMKVEMSDFKAALEEVKPAFGANAETLQQYCMHGIISSGDTFEHLTYTLNTLVEQVRSSEKTPVLSCLLEGPSGAGKSALAATVAMESGFPFIKVISPESMVGFSEQAKASQIAKVFEDAYKSTQSIIILDDIERLLEYVAIGPRFSNVVLQTLLVLVKRQPPLGRKIFVVGTSSNGDVMQSMGLSEVFNVNLHVSALREEEMLRVLEKMKTFHPNEIRAAVQHVATYCGKLVPIKKLMLWLEMAKQSQEEGERININHWESVLRDMSS